ncbi:MAG: YihY/virulence factor BrkB family protein [Pirellulales bacterium]|nr:YihY/virulence factor BrkB family protein [Pirellulales bacterium]
MSPIGHDESAVPPPGRGARYWGMLRETYVEWRDDKVSRLGAALAYYSFFSVGPLLLIAIVIAGAVYGDRAQDESTRQEFRAQVANYVGAAAAESVEGLMKAADRSHAGTLATLMGIAGLLFGATGAVVALKDALNTIWGVMEPMDAPWWSTLRDRLMSLVIVFAVGVLLLASSVLTAVLWSMARFAHHQLPIPLPAAQVVNWLVSLVMVTLLFAVIYKLLPDVVLPWRSALVGAAITAALFILGKELFALYVSYVGIGSAYGTAGSLAILLLFAYYSAQVFFFGAEFTQVYAREQGTTIVTRRGAVRVTEQMREQASARRKLDRQDAARRGTNAAASQPQEKPISTVTAARSVSSSERSEWMALALAIAVVTLFGKWDKK